MPASMLNKKILLMKQLHATINVFTHEQTGRQIDIIYKSNHTNRIFLLTDVPEEKAYSLRPYQESFQFYLTTMTGEDSIKIY